MVKTPSGRDVVSLNPVGNVSRRLVLFFLLPEDGKPRA